MGMGTRKDAIIDSGDAELHLLVPIEKINYYIHDIDSALRIQNWKLRFRRRLFVSNLGLSHARWQDEWIDQCEVLKATSNVEVLVNRGKPSLRARAVVQCTRANNTTRAATQSTSTKARSNRIQFCNHKHN